MMINNDILPVLVLDPGPGIYGQIKPSAFGSSLGIRPPELPQAEGYI